MKHTILIIDDEPEYVNMVRLRLDANGFKVVTAIDGVAGLEKARTCSPDLILLDIMLPGLDGGDVARALQSDPALSKIPVIFLTAAISEEESQRRWGRTTERILAKTMDARVIVERIIETLKGPRAP